MAWNISILFSLVFETRNESPSLRRPWRDPAIDFALLVLQSPPPSKRQISFPTPPGELMTRFIVVLGTCSHSGKSTIVAALCRILRDRGLKVSPFKSQNMSLNSWVTSEGKEMGIAQAVQAWAEIGRASCRERV